MTEPTARIVEMRGISIEFPGVKALQDVDLTLYQGEVHALMGENGAGKSTLIKALTGVYSIDSGSITIAGRKRTLNGTADAQRAGRRHRLPGSQPLHEPDHRREPDARARGPWSARHQLEEDLPAGQAGPGEVRTRPPGSPGAAVRPVHRHATAGGGQPRHGHRCEGAHPR